jgi:hypothetical protein
VFGIIVSFAALVVILSFFELLPYDFRFPFQEFDCSFILPLTETFCALKCKFNYLKMLGLSDVEFY